MKEKIKIIVLIVVLVICIFGIKYILDTETEKMINNDTFSEEYYDESEDLKVSSVITVTEDTFDEEVLNSDKKVVVDFYADWCGPCKQMEPIFEKVASETKDVKFVRLNVDYAQELSLKYGAYSIPFLVVFENGEVVETNTGLISESTLKELIK